MNTMSWFEGKCSIHHGNPTHGYGMSSISWFKCLQSSILMRMSDGNTHNSPSDTTDVHGECLGWVKLVKLVLHLGRFVDESADGCRTPLATC